MGGCLASMYCSNALDQPRTIQRCMKETISLVHETDKTKIPSIRENQSKWNETKRDKKRIFPSFISKYRFIKKIASILAISVIHSSLFAQQCMRG